MTKITFIQSGYTSITSIVTELHQLGAFSTDKALKALNNDGDIL